MAINIAYFVHDLDDPAVSRRVRMLSLGGAAVKLAGFHRSAKPIASVDGVQAVNLGKTEPAKLLWRTLSVAKVAINLNAAGDALRNADVIIARNLEMLLLAVRARNHFAPGVPVVYECLDIHRLLLSGGSVGRVLRLLEDSLWRQTDLLLTSSPAFIRNYFAPRKFPSAVQLVENKVLHLEHEADSHELKRPAPGEPWRIGWFGVLRCRKSFDMLSRLTRELPGRVEVVLRGRPAPSIFPDFESEVARAPGMSFGGQYCNPADLSAIYGGVHFAWALDYFEESQNSAWLLPNRIYEGCLWGAVPLALGGVETGNWLAKREAGVLLPDPPYQALLGFFQSLDADHYQKLAASVLRIPRDDLVDDVDGCRALVEALPRKKQGPPQPKLPARPSLRNHFPPGEAHMLLDDMNLATGDAAMPRAQADPAKPAVLAIIPCLNEASNIQAITGQLLDEANRIPLRIVIADGGSTDGTRDIIQSLSAADERVSFLDNKKRIQSAALNKAVQELGGGAEFLIRVDAHSRYPAGYCESLLAEQARTGADCVVVSMVAEGKTFFQRAAAAAQNSVLGNGGSAHRKSGDGRFVDHGHHALMRLSAFQSVGGYDETFSHNEDAELDTRFRAAGFKIWLSGAEPIGYFPRRSVRALFSQYLNYGRGRARTVFKHRMRPKLRQSLPLAVAPALMLAVLAPLHPIFAVPAASWMAICAGHGLLLSVRERSACVAMSGPAAMVMHFGWSAGFLREAVKYIAKRQFGGSPASGKPVPVALQRDGIAS